MLEVIGWIKDYADLLVGLVFLAMAVYVIPGRARWYVLTAGLAFLGYEVYVRTRNRMRLKEADAERDKLRQHSEALMQQAKGLEAEVARINKDLERVVARRDELEKEASALQARGRSLDQDKPAAAREREDVLREVDTLRQRRSDAGDVLSQLEEMRRAMGAVEQAAAR